MPLSGRGLRRCPSRTRRCHHGEVPLIEIQNRRLKYTVVGVLAVVLGFIGQLIFTDESMGSALFTAAFSAVSVVVVLAWLERRSTTIND